MSTETPATAEDQDETKTVLFVVQVFAGSEGGLRLSETIYAVNEAACQMAARDFANERAAALGFRLWRDRNGNERMVEICRYGQLAPLVRSSAQP